MKRPARFLRNGLTLCCVSAVLSGVCWGQVVSRPNSSKNPAIKNNSPVLLPGLGVAPAAQNQQVTPEQALGIMQLRALQSRGRGQVRTGIPQFIPMGPQALMGPPSLAPAQSQDDSRKTSSQKRIEARKAREEQKQAAREEAKAKKAKAQNVKKDGAAKKAKADKDPPAEEK